MTRLFGLFPKQGKKKQGNGRKMEWNGGNACLVQIEIVEGGSFLCEVDR